MRNPDLPEETPYREIHAERIRAHAKHRDGAGGSMETKPWDHPIWLAVVTEEIGEVARVLCDRNLEILSAGAARGKLRDELVQVGAMVAAWIDALDDPARGTVADQTRRRQSRECFCGATIYPAGPDRLNFWVGADGSQLCYPDADGRDGDATHEPLETGAES